MCTLHVIDNRHSLEIDSRVTGLDCCAEDVNQSVGKCPCTGDVSIQDTLARYRNKRVNRCIATAS